MKNIAQNGFVLVPVELSQEAATKRAEEQFIENLDFFKSMNRYCTSQELERQKTRWIEHRAAQLQEQYRALVKVVGRTP
ncbi:hypothetical protein F896_01151 [Acinetobacter genomosp. 15BJ]|uniref:Uncharacterized protein n=1 Tax=Acinetobacter genomosp. 15BJ TaxID=106651 RepID=R9B2V0_9GAMM|nr:hypothetical protein [Acinetobacter genomosp. 15BJ]EOR08625.1 hypothetical protein F896_01151 [Acinetobacter genomosp. 15BJ]